ncbi:hypothetical protein [Phocaeicola abscessus]|uniref:hypothetical protein n=1 Tax=Phocaeicola abscessus TaxID=555313 RepID=UPI00038673C0|nr:hypothetical protein [Phocaeicola abscessus]EPT33037.1 hypothetical protein HMPREF9012_1071 [Bacteroidetes bacterium oral taxon 272 str. F0290]
MKMDKTMRHADEQTAGMRSRDLALREALRRKLESGNALKCPTNLSYLTMRRIQEKKSSETKRIHLLEAALLFLVSAGGIAALVLTCTPFFEEFFHHSFKQLAPSVDAIPSNPTLWAMTSVCLLFFVGLNTLLRHYFGKKD